MCAKFIKILRSLLSALYRMASLEEQSEDLSTCCVCLELYHEENRKPKFLSCHHTLCLNCIKVSIFYIIIVS